MSLIGGKNPSFTQGEMTKKWSKSLILLVNKCILDLLKIMIDGKSSRLNTE